jgi:hypothetical protein
LTLNRIHLYPEHREKGDFIVFLRPATWQYSLVDNWLWVDMEVLSEES